MFFSEKCKKTQSLILHPFNSQLLIHALPHRSRENNKTIPSPSQIKSLKISQLPPFPKISPPPPSYRASNPSFPGTSIPPFLSDNETKMKNPRTHNLNNDFSSDNG